MCKSLGCCRWWRWTDCTCLDGADARLRQSLLWTTLRLQRSKPRSERWSRSPFVSINCSWQTDRPEEVRRCYNPSERTDSMCGHVTRCYAPESREYLLSPLTKVQIIIIIYLYCVIINIIIIIYSLLLLLLFPIYFKEDNGVTFIFPRWLYLLIL